MRSCEHCVAALHSEGSGPLISLFLILGAGIPLHATFLQRATLDRLDNPKISFWYPTANGDY